MVDQMKMVKMGLIVGMFCKAADGKHGSGGGVM
jgi:hypothetical protein